jgi:dienelactone hydrolase
VEAVPTVLAWAEEVGFHPARIALLGFGAGGRAALAGAEAVPVVALYPGCRGLGFAPRTQALVLQGAEAPDAASCEALTVPEGVTVRGIPGLGHGWDVPGSLWPAPGPKLPDPAGGARIQAHTDLGGTLAVAEMVADHLEAAFGGLRAASR